METQILHSGPKLQRYGITEKKKAELDSLKNQVIDAGAIVQQQQIIVNSLNEKATKYQGYLLVADANRTHALSNKNLIDQVVQNAYDLGYNSRNAFNKTTASSGDASLVAENISDLINKLIYSVEIINKLSNLVIRKKALNPLISDDLISRINTAGTDANNAVALTLIALKSTLAAEASILESEAAITLENKQATKLYLTLTDEKSIDAPLSLQPVTDSSIRALLYNAYKNSQLAYDKANIANDETARQLNYATTNLSKAQIKLQSLQSGLAAATAAALAS
ncbi:hypothetical protein C8C83_4198 [Flavobacterium sp. 90]|uniref:hypothetical protein n=1 Tax=unclassified Flavobacterium TaxID=196869 RepID=UPI000EB29244|nr:MULTISPECIES: hypothetical protein [unclassified Flavobacterium]RKR04865.1 hypothetical protein C8C82_4531 [Flavobacterium sp. 81]TCK56186.1 hypothetical protein C8C83_4198 [Flavobacterium sp. 90]